MARGGKRPGAGRKPGSLTPGSVSAKRKATRQRLLRDEALSVESTVESIRRGQQYDARRLFDAEGNIRPIQQLSEEEAWCIAGFEVVIKNAAAGDGHTDTVHKVKLVDRGRYVELAAKHLGMLVERLEVSGEVTLATKIAAARKRLGEQNP